MHPMISLLILFLVTGSLLIGASTSLAIAFAESHQAAKTADASETWSNIRLRNGITEPSPWHPPEASINRPGLVQVHPLTQPPVHPWEVEPVPDTPPPVVSDLVAELADNKGSSQHAPASTDQQAPLELSEPPDPQESIRVMDCHRDGLGQVATIEAVWGIKRGSSKRYQEARRRYQQYTTTKELTNA